MRSWFRVGLRLGVLAGAVFAVVLATRSRRSATQPGTGPGRSGTGATGPQGSSRPTGVHGQWPEIPRAGAPVEGDHHPHGRVTVPREAAPLGAPPALATDPPGPTEPEAPEPREHLDEETGRAPAKRAPERRPPAKPATKSATKSTGRKAPTGSGGAKRAAGSAAPWVAPEGRECPATHPVKVKLASKLYHLPGMLAYDRTVPDRCYVDPAAAEADGFARAKR